ncbi:MAG: S-layer homology domain-containing protein [Dehalobacterium sp.]
MKKRFVKLSGLILTLVMLLQGGVLAEGVFTGKQGEDSIKKAVVYLHSMQNPDGGFCAKKDGASSKALTSWVVMALVAAGEDISSSSWAPGGKSPVDFLKSSNQPLEETCDYARLLLAYTASGNSQAEEARALETQIISFQQEEGQFCQPDQGETGMINSHMWSILALVSMGKEIPQKEKAKDWLLSQQNDDGGFGWVAGMESDADDTGVAIQTLILLGEDADTPAIQKALAFLQSYQQESGGFSAGEWMGQEANAASDVWVVQGLLAAGENPLDGKWTVNGKNPITHLLSLQNQDGSFNWKEGVSSSPVTTTAYAVMALAGKSFPVNLSYGDHNSNNFPAIGLFSDLAPDYWAYSSIKELVEAGVLGGYPDGTFGPERPVTRGEFTKFMVCGLGMQNQKSDTAAKFSDIPADHWARPFVSVALDQGYINGRSGNVFDLNGKISGAELAAMLVRALPEEKKTELTQGAQWYSGYVKMAREEGLLYPEFQETAGATRAQCAFSISQLAKFGEEK